MEQYKTLIVLLVTMLLIAGPHHVGSASTSQELKQQCQDRTGLIGADFKDFHKRNEGCAVDCTTRQGTIMSYYVSKGTKCGEQDGYSCVFGRCMPKGDSNLELSNLYSLEVKVLSAHVPDLDTLPMGGPSDAFVVVEAHRNGDPSYKDNELMCHTYVVQDNENPRWNFKCKPLPMRLNSRIKFDVFDSDKPSENHDHIGYATRTVEELINKGPQRLALKYRGSEENHDYHVFVEVKGQEYDSEAQ